MRSVERGQSKMVWSLSCCEAGARVLIFNRPFYTLCMGHEDGGTPSFPSFCVLVYCFYLRISSAFEESEGGLSSARMACR